MATNDKPDELSPEHKDPEFSELAPAMDQDEIQLNKLGYKQQLHRSWNYVENFATSFVSMGPANYNRAFIFLGLLSGGSAAVWSSYLISIVFMMITAAVLAEICSALPISGSVYIWAAASAGPKYARFFGFLVAWWSSAGWTAFIAGICQTSANYIASQLSVWEIHFPGGAHNDNVKWRTFIWALSEAFLLLAVAMNYLPPRVYSVVLKFAAVFCFIDFFLTLIWLPIGVSRTYGFRTAKEVFTTSFDGTNAPNGWGWFLSFLFTAGAMIGFDASGHVAEETRHANIIAARGMLTTASLTGTMGFLITILFLFCTPDLTTLFSSGAPQPFVQIYAMALGRGASIFMTIIAVIGLNNCASTVIVAASRLVFAVARDGVLPLSSWIARVDDKKQPKNAITVVYIFAALVLCTILPSQVAFTSVVASGSIFITSSYGIISLLRLVMTPDGFQWSKFKLGPFAKYFYAAAACFNAILFAVEVSPFFFPVTAETFNFAVVVFAGISIFAILSWWFIPEDRWLPREQIMRVLKVVDEETTDQTEQEVSAR